MDQSTVTRNLGVLEKIGYVKLLSEDRDHRIKRIQLTDSGKDKVKEARPLWRKAQLEMEHALGKESIEGLLDSYKKMAE